MFILVVLYVLKQATPSYFSCLGEWEWVDSYQIFNFGWTFPLMLDGIAVNVETEEGYVWADPK